MLRAKTYRKMQIGLGVLLVAAVLLTVMAVAWTPVSAAGGSPTSPSGGISPKGCVTTYYYYDYQPCGTCGWGREKVLVYTVVEDPCSGWGPIYYYDYYYY